MPHSKETQRLGEPQESLRATSTGSVPHREHWVVKPKSRPPAKTHKSSSALRQSRSWPPTKTEGTPGAHQRPSTPGTSRPSWCQIPSSCWENQPEHCKKKTINNPVTQGDMCIKHCTTGPSKRNAKLQYPIQIAKQNVIRGLPGGGGVQMSTRCQGSTRSRYLRATNVRVSSIVITKNNGGLFSSTGWKNNIIYCWSIYTKCIKNRVAYIDPHSMILLTISLFFGRNWWGRDCLMYKM